VYNAPLVLLLDITVNNNDVLRRLRYTFNLNDKQMAAVFASAEENFTREQISQWLKKDNDADFVAINDTQLAIFLNGFINDKRGKKPGEQVAPEKKLTNNIILTKLKIALNLKAEELIELLNTVDFRLSKPELSAFSRKADHKHYRECKDQVLRNLLQAIDKKYHVARTKKIIKSDENRIALNHGKTHQGEQKSKNVKKSAPFVEGARPNASVIYENPKHKVKPKRNQLKLSK
jgi:uncharacterized protein YehS (DUF1456 family)